MFFYFFFTFSHTTFRLLCQKNHNKKFNIGFSISLSSVFQLQNDIFIFVFFTPFSNVPLIHFSELSYTGNSLYLKFNCVGMLIYFNTFANERNTVYAFYSRLDAVRISLNSISNDREITFMYSVITKNMCKQLFFSLDHLCINLFIVSDDTFIIFIT